MRAEGRTSGRDSCWSDKAMLVMEKNRIERGRHEEGKD